MATTINADDGVISGSAGLKSTADASGELALQSNGTTVQTITSSGAVISVNSSSDALRITQVGTGNALVVEDASPDNAPFVIDTAGRILTGILSAQGSIFGGGYNPQIQVWGVGPATTSQSFASFNTAGTGNGSRMWLARSRGSFTSGVPTYGIVSNGDTLGDIQFSGDDGTVSGTFVTAAQILAQVDGTPGTNDMPGRLIFSTTADGASSPTERLRIDSAGDINMAATSSLQKNSINAYTLKNITYLTSGTAATYTTPTGVRALKVTTIGGGGGGGGVNGSSTASTNAYSDGGGGGGYATAFIATAEASYTYTVGSGGTGGAVGNNAGATGGTTEFKNAGATIIVSATGGAGGLGDTGATSTGATAGAPGVGSITGLGTPGGVIGSGTGIYANGYGRFINGTAYGLAGSGYCPLIGGGVESALGATGINATRYGEGGGNVRTSTAVATDYAGGNGFAGLIIVEEYY